MKGNDDSQKFLSAKRDKKRQRRNSVLLQRATANRRGGTKLPELHVAFGNTLLGFLAREMGHPNVAVPDVPIVVIPESFSVIENPAGVIDTLRTIVAYAKGSRHLRGIYFDHSKVQKNDLAAEQLLGALAAQIERAYQRAGKQVRFGGRYPATHTATRLVRAMGVIKRLKVTGHYISGQDSADLAIFDAHRRESGPEEVVFGAQDRKGREMRAVS